MVLKIDYDTIKFQKVTYVIIFMTSPKIVIKIKSQNFTFSSLSLCKVLVALSFCQRVIACRSILKFKVMIYLSVVKMFKSLHS